ncbi:hypothetical protein G6F56_013008 [Rhizopus delemar]|nr:hypothetical protein G6F56_013008 [Rhizopus delemar]
MKDFFIVVQEMWYDFTDLQSLDRPHVPACPRKRDENEARFFGQNNTGERLEKNVVKCIVREKNVYNNAHDGYVYCLLAAKDIPNIEGEVLISGSGDDLVYSTRISSA